MHLKNKKKVTVEITGGRIFFLAFKSKADPKALGYIWLTVMGVGERMKKRKIARKQCYY